MKRLLSKAKSTLQELHDSTNSKQKQTPLQDHQTPYPMVNPPTPTDVIRYRYHHGTNLGSIFVLERWLHWTMFPSEKSGGSELDAVTLYLRSNTLEATRDKWQKHWANAISDAQFEWLVKEAKCTSIRLPVGYFTLGGDHCNGTPFEGVKGIYVNAWNAVKEFTRRARGWGIGTLIDFHAVQGGANREEHSGTTSGRADLWESQQNRNAAKRSLRFIAEEVRNGALEGVIGIQLVNESTHVSKDMYGWYEDVIREIGSVDESIPIYISDAWNLETCLKWANGRKIFETSPKNPVVIDTHKYYTFGDEDKKQSPYQIIGRLPGELSELNGREGSLSDRGEGQVIVGEYSCVLDTETTWKRAPTQEKPNLVKQFGQAQSKRWQEKSGGSYFWTYKMDWPPGGEWGFEDQTRKNNISPPYSLTLPAQDIRNRIQNANNQRGQFLDNARNSHIAYWNATAPGKTFPHELYSQGWEVGFSDALAFLKMRGDGALGRSVQELGGDKIGCLEIWTKKRLLESGVRGEYVWIWEQGFRNGVKSFYTIAGV